MPLLDDFEPSGLSSFGQNIAPNKRGALGAGLASGFEDLKGLGYSTGAAVADVVGADTAREWLDKQAKEKEYRSFVASRPELERIEDQSLSSALPYAGYQVAKQIPNVVGAVGMGMVAPEAAVPAALSRAGAVLPRALGGGGLEAGASIAARRAAAEAGQTFGKQIVGGAAFNEAQAVGSLYQAAREGGDENAGRTALLASPAYALAETLPEAMLVGRVAHGSGFTGNLLQRSLKTGATQGATGATSEILQTGMEQAVGKELTPEERRSQYLNAGVAGGLVEGLLGLPGGFRSGKPLLSGANQAPAQGNAPSGEISQAITAKDVGQPDIATPSFQAPVAPIAAAPQVAPAVTGGTTDVAQAATGITQAEFAAQQRQQQDEANRIAREKTFQTLGAQYSPEKTGQLDLFGGTLFDDAKISVFGNALSAKFNALPETAHIIADAIAQANELTGGKVIKVDLNAGNPVGSANTVMKALAKTADNFQIGHVENVQQAAAILETLSRNTKGNKLDQLNAIHYALTGEDTTGFTEAQQAKTAKGAKDDKLQLQTTTGVGTVPVQGSTGEAVSGGNGPVRPTEVQPIGAASVGEGPLGLQVGQLPAEGIRPSPGAGASVGSGEPTQNPQVSEALNEANQPARPKAKLGVPVRVKAAGKQGAPSVQPTPAPAPKAAQREEAKLSPAEELWNDMDATDTPYASLTPALKQAWERAVETKQATGAIQEEIADQAGDRAQETKADRLIAGVLQMVIRPYGRMDEASAQKKREFFQAFWGGAKLDSLTDIAESMGITKDQALKWHAELPNFLENNSAKIIAAAASVAESQGMTMRDLEQLLEGIEAKRHKKASTAAQVTGEEEDTGQGTSATEEPIESDTIGEEEFGQGAADLIGTREEEGPAFEPEATEEAEAAPDLNIRNRKTLSTQERYNAVDTNQARIVRLMDYLDSIAGAQDNPKAMPKSRVETAEAKYEAALLDLTKLGNQDLHALAFDLTQKGNEGEASVFVEELQNRLEAQKKIAVEQAKKQAAKFNKEKPNAVQVESANAGNVRQPAGGGEEVGKANTEPKKPARARKAKIEEAKPAEAKVEEVKTDAEKAAIAWDAAAKDIPGAPLFADLTEDQRETFIEYGEENWTRADVVAELKKLSGPLENIERLTDGPAMFGAVTRLPSLSRGLTKLRKDFDAGNLSPEAFATRVELLHNSVLAAKKEQTRQPRQRGDLYLRERLLAAARKGELDEYGVAMADWFIRQKVSLFADVGISIRDSKSGIDASGHYEPLRRIVTLLKGSGNYETAVHELLHHLERMMPDTVQDAIRQAWLTALAKEAKKASKGTNADLKAYFEHVLDFHIDGDLDARNAARKLLEDSKVGYEFYQYFNASEFWAMNATALVHGRWQATRGTVAQLKQWFKEFIAKVKAVFGNTADASIIRALDSIFKGDGKFVPGQDMIKAGVEYDMFAGKQAVRSESSEARFADAVTSIANGEDPRAVWEQTGWYKAKDGQWRFEIDDSGAQFKGVLQGKKFSDIARMEESTLGEILEHEELFDAYPELRDVKFEVRPVLMDVYRGTQGWFDEKKNKLFVTPYAANPLSTVLHEIQHWIQAKEGFENGANPSTVDLSNVAALHKVRAQAQQRLDRLADLEAKAAEDRKQGKYTPMFDHYVAARRAEDLIPAINSLLVHNSELKPLYKQLVALDAEIDRVTKAREVLTAKFKAENKKANLAKRMIDWAGQQKDLNLYANKARAATKERDAVNSQLKELIRQYTGGVDVAHEMYRLVAGEAEARNTQTRQELEFGERATSFPEDTMDVGADFTLKSTGPGGAYMNIERLPKKLQAPTKTVVDTLLNSGKATMINRNEDVKHILLAAGITEDVVNGATKFMPSAQDYLNSQYERQGTRIEHEQRIQRIEEAFEKLPTELQGTGRGSVNEFIFDSTSDSKWGYVPAYNPNIKPDDEMARRFDAMPDAAQRVIKMVFEHGYQSLRLKQKAVKVAADKEFSQREADANGDQEILNEIAAERTAWESKFDRLMNIKNDMPYAYLGRYGDYVAVAKSETYVDAEELAAKGDLDAAKWLEENQSDANHYIVEFAETMAEAQAKAEQWKATGRFKHVYGAEKEVSEAFVGGSDLFMGITRLRNMLTRRIKSGEMTIADQETLNALHKTVSDLYLATVSEASAHRTAMQRKNISGADKDMMRNLATRGRADAHFLASLKHNEDITDAISNMRDEAKADPTNARPYLNELLKRYANDINYKTPSVWSRTLTRMGHTWFLSFNPAFYLQQMTQTYVLSLPYMAGRLGYHRSLRAINSAYKDVVNLVKDTNVNEHLDFSKAPADVRDMLLKLVRMGKIDIGIDADAVVYANERTLTSSVMRKLNGVNNRIEAVNRATAAVAAYRGYLQRYGANNTEAATKFAAETVSNTHGSYDGFNTPRILNSNVGRVVGQFKRFQIIQLSMLGKLIKNSFNGASAEEKMVARRSLAFIASHMAVLGGALGVPFVSQLANLMTKLFGDDDEPKDLEYKLRQAIGDPTLASLLTRGVPAALGMESVGKKLAMENVASILPFTDTDFTSRSGAEKMLVGLMGPTASLGLKAADALGLVGKGEYYKGLEQALPSGFANAMKGYRFATEGITMRNGDVVLSPEEISMVDAAFQAIGLPTGTITGRQYRQNVEKEFDKFYMTRATEIKGDYVNANREGDSSAMAEARQNWQELQDARAKNGYTKQPMSELFKAIMAARKREASVSGGVETTKANRGFVQNII